MSRQGRRPAAALAVLGAMVIVLSATVLPRASLDHAAFWAGFGAGLGGVALVAAAVFAARRRG